MTKSVIKLERISLNNFKNISHGEIDLSVAKGASGNGVLGVYGQNGSGKTAMIDSLTLVQSLMRGFPVRQDYVNFIHVNEKSAELKFDFSMMNKYGELLIKYSFDLCKQEAISKNDKSLGTFYRPLIQNEKLRFSLRKNGDILYKEQMLIDASDESSFGPATKYEELIGKNNDDRINLMVIKRMAASSGTSFVFSKELIRLIKKNCKNEMFFEILKSMSDYATENMFVICNSFSDNHYENALPLSFSVMYEKENYFGEMPLPLDEPFSIEKSEEQIVEKVITGMNIVLTQLVPGLTIGIKKIGTELNQYGKESIRVQIVSKKNKTEIPLKYESEGIKKIVSVLELLIVVYNKPNYTVAIDELDAGIFEYLLGELLRVISNHGKGQLIFTSHNLRPLETLDKNMIVFTTINSKNRYIRLANIKPTNNLRDLYYRNIMLADQKEKLYDMTNNYEIELALKQAGDYIDA